MIAKDRALLFDGAMGTCLAQQYGTDVRQSELENINNPGLVLSVHRAYIDAGAQAIKTNTFAANTAALSLPFEDIAGILRAACGIAKDAAAQKDGTLVFASIGQVRLEQPQDEYEKIIGIFLENGVKNFLFETFDDYRPLPPVAAYIKRRQKDAFIIAEGTIMPDGFTTAGIPAQAMIDGLYACADIDAYGFNCASGPTHMLRIVQNTELYDRPVSAMPNAGYPTVVAGRTFFDSSPEYFAQVLVEIKRAGAQILGGCCGTTPAHIRAAREALSADGAFTPKKARTTARAGARKAPPEKSAGRQFAVELDTPFDTQLSQFTQNAQALHRAGADMITMADCPIGRARADSSMFAAMLRGRYGIPVLPHLTCRDRNLNATKALLLALNMQGITDVLVVTGDPIPMVAREQIRALYQFNSVKLASYIGELNKTIFAENPFRVSGALNINAGNFDMELDKARKKEDAGVARFLTQPVMGRRAVDNLKKAKAALSADILAGVMPVVSYKNACFLNNEVAGITIDGDLLAKYEGASREQATRLAISHALEMASMAEDAADGYYLITPLKRVDIICEVLKGLKT